MASIINSIRAFSNRVIHAVRAFFAILSPRNKGAIFASVSKGNHISISIIGSCTGDELIVISDHISATIRYYEYEIKPQSGVENLLKETIYKNQPNEGRTESGTN